MLLKNVYPGDMQEPADVRIESGAVLDIRAADPAADSGNTDRLYLIPAFTDLHVHGAGGADFSCGDAEQIIRADRTLRNAGTGTYLATAFYRPDNDNDGLKLLAEVCRSGSCPGMIGIHLEGPFISPVKRGGIPEDCTADFSDTILDDVFDCCGGMLKMMTLAPEITGAGQLIRKLQRNGVVPSMGHTDADAEMSEKALDTFGVSHVTHICNAMKPLHHRETGPLPAIFRSVASAQIIADGVHLSAGMIRFLYEMLGPDRCICITDGILSAGLPDGEYEFQGKPFISRGGEARYRDGGGLIGTSLTMADVLRRFMRFSGCGFSAAIRAGTSNPANVLGMYPQVGPVRTGSRGPFLLTDDALNIRKVIFG